ncbi:MAG: TIGR01777 family oxidoreductase [Caldilineaceae bacterium]
MIRESRIQVGLILQNAIQAAAQKPSIFVQASAVGYYGQEHGDELITEASPPAPIFWPKSVLTGKCRRRRWSIKGIRRVVLRTGIVLSNAGGALPKMTLPFKFFAGGPLGNGNQWLPWIHIADEVRAIQYLLTHEQTHGPYNLCAPNPVTNKQFSQIVGSQMGRPAFLPAPAFAIKTVLGGNVHHVARWAASHSTKLEEAGFIFQYPTAQEALSQLLK